MPAKLPEIHFDWNLFQATLSEELDSELNFSAVEAVKGGDTSRGFKVSTEQADFFVKLNRVDAEEMFRTEWAGLAELRAVAGLRVPGPIFVGSTQNAAFFVMEYIPLLPKLDQTAAGSAIANLHSITHNQYGWERNNFLGSNIQQNGWHQNWSEFYWNCRLEPQLVKAAESGFHLLEQAIEPLREKSNTLLAEHQPTPALLHGDLWHGNIATADDSQVVVYDPAVYWGDPETDIAMTKMFGGFDEAFEEAYSVRFSESEGQAERLPLYQLYHWLNHLNLFGQSYLDPTLTCISQLYETASE